MFSSQAAEISLQRAPIRALEAVRGDQVDNRFVAGSCRVNEDNHLYMLRFHSDSNQWIQDATLSHPSPVSKICTNPTDKSSLLTIAEDSSVAKLYKLPYDATGRTGEMGVEDDEDEDDNRNRSSNNMNSLSEVMNLEEQATLTPSSSDKLADMKWRGGSYDENVGSGMGDVLTLDVSGQLTQWDIGLGSAEATQRCAVPWKGEPTWDLTPRLAWDPHNSQATAVAAGTYINVVDWRAGDTTATVESSFRAHRYGIADLDFNPNKPHVLATAGQDGLIKFWDLRQYSQPLLITTGGHRHWLSRVLYNPFHDQLVLSAGTDATVNLWRISSISSAPLLTLEDDEDDQGSKTTGPNVLVSRQEHIDSVYAAAWGAADAWIYATAGYDGKVAMNHVPSKEKYKILL